MLDIVIGAGFGDEGKGQTVFDLICDNIFKGNPNDYVIRFNGGHQAGHTVVFENHRHVFSNFGCGTFKNIPTYWSKFCTVHPLGLLNEHETLTELGYDPVLYIDPMCPLTLPQDIVLNQTSHGTVGVGFGQTIQRNEDHFKIYAGDLLNMSVLKQKISMMEKWYYDCDVDMSEFYDNCKELLSIKNIKIKRPTDIKQPIFEGAQGILLDQDLGFFPHVTRSKTTACNALQLIKEFNLTDTVLINYVSRTYSTRHGDGPLNNEDLSDLLDLRDDVIETNEFNEHQGSFRKTILDIDLLEYSIKMANLELNDTSIKTRVLFTCSDHHKCDRFFVSYCDRKIKVDVGSLEHFFGECNVRY